MANLHKAMHLPSGPTPAFMPHKSFRKIRLVEFKPRKTKFGFKIEGMQLDDIHTASDVLNLLESKFRGAYFIEFGAPYKNVFFKVYTDVPEVAAAINKEIIGV